MGRSTPGRKRGLSEAEILQAAREIILGQGIEALSMRTLATRLRRSAAGLYEYFPDKTALLCALAENSSRALRAYLDEAPGEPGSARRLEEMCLAYLAFAREQPDLFRVLFDYLPSQRRSLREGVPRQAPYGALVIEAWRWGVALKRVQASIPDGAVVKPHAWVEKVAFSLWALVHGIAELERGTLAEFEGVTASARHAVRALMRGWSAS